MDRVLAEMVADRTNLESADGGAHEPHRARLAAGIVLLVVLVAIVLDNREKARVGFVLGDVEAPLIVVLVATAIVGAAIGWLLLHVRRRRSE